jgi:hypothetical protein
VSTEEPIGVGQEQLFKEEQSEFLGEEGKWSSPTCIFYFILYNCMTTKFTVYDIA